MNKQRHRLVFNRYRGMLLAVAENARASGKASCGEGRGNSGLALGVGWSARLARLIALALAVAAALPAVAQTRPAVVFASKLPAPLTNLPVANTNAGRSFAYDPAKGDPRKGGTSADLFANGQVGWTQSADGKTATFDQGSVERVVINWDSFNIGAGYSLHFKQDTDPTKYVSALNRIWSADPSVILGSLTADREVVLLNANGVYFGRGARVDTGKFVATALSIADSVYQKGLRNVTDGSAVFSTVGTDYVPTNLVDSAISRSAAVSVEAGAEIRSAAGGDVLLIAPRVVNAGRIETPKGQAVLAAGGKVYLMSSSDPKQRGLIVAVDPVPSADGSTPDATLGTAENAAVGTYKTVGGATVPDSTPDATSGLVSRINEIRAESGTVNLVGLAVRQNGNINATTAVKGANGAIYLEAMASTAAAGAGAATISGSAGARGLTIESGSTARVSSQLGTVEIGAPSVTTVLPDTSSLTQIDAEVFNASRIRVAGQAISVATGAKVLAPSGSIDLLAAEFASGVLFDSNQAFGVPDSSRVVIASGATVSAAGLPNVAVDGGRYQGNQRLFRIELADAPVQRSGPLYRSQVFFDLRDAAKISVANVAGSTAALARTSSEKSTAGGSVTIGAQGAVVVADGAQVDVSGGSIAVPATVVQNSLVVRDGKVMAFNSAAAGTALDGLIALTRPVVTPGYTEGQAGGSLALVASKIALGANAVLGSVVEGLRQRDGTSTRAAPASFSLGRSATAEQYLPGVSLRSTALPALDGGLLTDPLRASLAAVPDTTQVSLPGLQAAGFGAVRMLAQRIDQPDWGELQLGPSGRLEMSSGSAMSLDGAFKAPGGSITLSSLGTLQLSSASQLVTAGLWTNDTVAGAGGRMATVQVNAGTVSAVAGGQLIFAPGSRIDVSAGAWLNKAGAVKLGQAGTLTVSATQVLAVGGGPGGFDGVLLSAYDFSAGGSLKLAVQDLVIGSAQSTVVAAGGFSLAPEFFASSGFGSISINASAGVRLLSGTALAPVLLNWAFSPGYRQVASGAMRGSVAQSTLIDTRLADRKPVNLSLNATLPLDPLQPGVLDGADVVIERASRIELDAAGQLALSATRRVSVGTSGGLAGQSTTMSAPGGSIALSVTSATTPPGDGPSVPFGFAGAAPLQLGAGAQLNVSGVAVTRNANSTTFANTVAAGQSVTLNAAAAGQILGGGTIALNTLRGYVAVDRDASLLLDGVSASFAFAGLPQPVRIAKPAGTLSVQAADGFALDGTVSARAPVDAQGLALADGGRLSLSVISPFGRQFGSGSTARTLAIGPYDTLLAVGGVVPQAGVGYVRTALLGTAGFDRLSLDAGDLIRFNASLALNYPLGLQLNAPALAAAPGVQVAFRAGITQIGDLRSSSASDLPRPQAVADTSTTQPTRLSIASPVFDLVGDWSLQGFSHVSLDASANARGEIRFSEPALIGNSLGNSTGSRLSFPGRLSLIASQVYTTSGSLYTVAGLVAAGPADAGSTLSISLGATGAAGLPPLSALGGFAATATQIDQGGVIRQPFGSISLTAERTLSLGPGSITSVSGDGGAVPFGGTTNLTTWNSPLGEATTLPRSKTLALGANQLLTAGSATLSARGGGSVLATEFFPGVGGSKDYYLTPGLYAVLPDYASTSALAFGGGQLTTGQGREIVITTLGSGLAPGRYTAWPARYALLGALLPQGAYLVSRAADQGKAVLDRALQQDDGSTIVAAYLTDAGSVTKGAPGERYVVEPTATVQARSDIRLTDISKLLEGRAQTLGQSSPLLPRDAGQIQLTASGSQGGSMLAKIDLAPVGGLGGLLDISATRLLLAQDLNQAPEGTLVVNADAIASSGAGSVLLGGVRTVGTAAVGSTVPVLTIDQSATERVNVDLGSRTLQVEELLLAARNSVTLAPGSRLSANGSPTLGPRVLQSSGDGALLAVSANALDFVRSGVALTAGDVVVGAGSVLKGAQVGLDASRQLSLDGSSLQATSLRLGARRIVIGTGAAADANASVLSGSFLESIRQADSFSLLGYESIDFVGRQDFAQRPAGLSSAAPSAVGSRLVLDSPLIRGLDAQGGAAASTDIAARSVLLRNTTGLAAAVGAVGQGSLTLEAIPGLTYGRTGGLTIGPGALALAFDSVVLRSTGDIVIQGSGNVRVQRDLSLSSARVTASTGASQSIAAAGNLTVSVEAGSRTLGEQVGVGASVNWSASTLTQNGNIDLPAGDLGLTALGVGYDPLAVRFGAGSLTSVAGRSLGGADSFDAYSLPGTISVSAGLGGIQLLGTLDASAAAAGNAGRVSLSAAGVGGQLVLSQSQADGSLAQASLLARAGTSADLGGRLQVDVTSMPNLDALANAAAAGGFTREQSVRVRTGNVALSRDILAQRITLSADAGALTLGAVNLNAASAAGGVVQLTAGNDLSVASGARIDARSSRSGANGGDVLLASTSGRLKLASGAVIDATGDDAADGRIVLRAQRGSSNTSVNVDPLNTANLKAGEVDIEAVRRYTGITAINAGNTSGSTLGQTTVNADSTTFMNAKSSVLSALGVITTESSSGRVSLRAGVDVSSIGNLALSTDWLFNAARPGGDAGFLTLRAAGNLNFTSGSLSDGFVTSANAASAANTGVGIGSGSTYSHAWSFRLVAGADLSAANPLDVNDLSNGSAGDLTIGAGRLVRTGAGSIEMSAGRDIKFQGGTSSTVAQGMAYAAGRIAPEQPGLLAGLFSSQSAKPTFTEQGGRVELRASRDIYSAEATQLINPWLWRTGITQANGTVYAASSQLAWWTQFDRFRQTVGSFGGGNLTVNAGHDITNLQAMVPTQAWADSKVPATATLQVRNGGDLTVSAGNDIQGGQFLLGRGVATLRAEGNVGLASDNVRTAKSPVLSLMDGRIGVAARGSLSVNGAFDPTAVPTSSADNRSTLSPFLYTWAGAAALSLNSGSGDLILQTEISSNSDLTGYGLFSGSLATPVKLFAVMPPSLRLTAAAGNASLYRQGNVGGTVLFPSSTGGLNVWAGGDVSLGAPLAMADSSLAAWPSFATPLATSSYSALIGTGSNGLIPGTLANVVTGTALHFGDTEPARVHAEGSILTLGQGRLSLPKAAQITAGQDVLSLIFIGQNQQSSDTTVIQAGRNLLAGTLGTLSLAGPGALELTAGRQFDLESSPGVATTGNIANPTLPAQGAEVRVRSAAAGTLDVAAFRSAYLVDVDQGGSPRAASYRDLLVSEVRDALKLPTLDYDSAWSLFQTFPAVEKARFGQRVLAAEFGAVYLTPAPQTTDQYLDTLRAAFERHKAEVLQAGADALAASRPLVLPGREQLQGSALSAYLSELQGLSFASLDLGGVAAARLQSLAQVRTGWRDSVAAQLGGTTGGFDALAQKNPSDPAALAFQAALVIYSGPVFERYRQQVFVSEAASAGANASLFGRKSLPMRLALFDQGFLAGELSGAGSFVPQSLWKGSAPAFSYAGSMELTQSSIVTQRGGGIRLVGPGGAINVGLKDIAGGSASGAKGVIALGGGNVFGYAKGDFQVNTQRVFIVGSGDMNIWSSTGDIDSGRGANTAVAAPPLAARRSVDGVIFEVPATTTGSGLGILENAQGLRSGTIGLFPALGEILALDAFIRAPQVVLGSTIKGADNLIASSVSGAAAPVSAPSLSVSPPANNNDQRVPTTGAAAGGADARQRSSLLTVELLGLGSAGEEERCTEADEKDGKCKRQAKKCSSDTPAGEVCR